VRRRTTSAAARDARREWLRPSHSPGYLHKGIAQDYPCRTVQPGTAMTVKGIEARPPQTWSSLIEPYYPPITRNMVALMPGKTERKKRGANPVTGQGSRNSRRGNDAQFLTVSSDTVYSLFQRGELPGGRPQVGDDESSSLALD
jgi:hypothetical protein